MGKTTNILDLNNRLEKVEKENVAQNNYNSLKNRPKINGNLLTGDKTGSQLGLAEAQDIGDMSELETTATNLVGAINEVKSGLTNLSSDIAVSYYGAVPNGKFGDNIVVTIPFWNPTNRQPVIDEAYIYDSDGGFTNILSGMSISKYTKTYLLVKFSYNANYVGKMIRVEII